MANSDIVVIGGGIAGLSAAAALATHAKVTVLEAEEQIGFHSSGRSATMFHYALGDRLIRALTLASRPFFDDPPEDFTETPIGRPMPVLVHAREDELAALDATQRDLSDFAALQRLDAAQVHELCSILKPDAVAGIADLDGIRLDPHALLQGNLRRLRRKGGSFRSGVRIDAIARDHGAWTVRAVGESFTAPIVINAAGAWADHVAQLAGVAPVGLSPKRRTIITFDAPAGTDLDRIPFTKTVGDELYFAPESGCLFASPMDEVPSDPCDAQPDEYEIALAAHRMEERTTVPVRNIRSKWAGLRSFTPDRHPAVGYTLDSEGFFWLAGQGGAGLQTSPAIAAIVESLVTGGPWTIAGVAAEELSPIRFARQPA